MDWIVPMEPILNPKVPEGDNFIHQVKWDGIRGMCYIQEGKISVFTKKGRERTDFYPELEKLTSLLKVKNAVLDGEIIILNKEMRPTFQLSLIRERVGNKEKVDYYARKYPVSYIVFDLLSFDSKLITHLPLSQRYSLLRENMNTTTDITITDNFNNGPQLLSLMKEKGWEGVVSKDLQSSYLPGKNHRLWFKTKLSRRILAIVAGLTLKEGNPNSLVLAIQGDEGLSYIGRASVGLTQEHLRLLKESLSGDKGTVLLSPYSTEGSTEYLIRNKRSKELKDVVWLKPLLTVWVSFLEWTNDGGLRHPKILNFTSLDPQEANGQEFVD